MTDIDKPLENKGIETNPCPEFPFFGAKYPLVSDVVQYIKGRNATGSLFDDDTATSCMSFYGLCE